MLSLQWDAAAPDKSKVFWRKNKKLTSSVFVRHHVAAQHALPFQAILFASLQLNIHTIIHPICLLICLLAPAHATGKAGIGFVLLHDVAV